MTKQPTQQPPFLTTAQTAARFGVTTRTVLNWIEAGRFPHAYKTGPETTTYLIPLQDVIQLEEKRRQSTQPD